MSQRVHAVLIAEFADEGGALTYSRMLLTHLLERGFTVAVIAFGPLERLVRNLGPLHKLVAVDQSDAEHITATSIGSFGRNPMGYLLESRKIYQLIKDAGWAPEFVISSVCSPGRFLGPGLRTAGHIQVHHTYPRGRAHWLAGPLFGWLSRGATLIGVSSFLSTRFNTVWRLRGRKAVVALANTAGHASEVVPTFEERDNVVPTVGAVSWEKNPRAVIELARAVRDRSVDVGTGEPLRFVWLGSGPLLASIKDEVHRHGLEATFFLEGFQSDPSSWYRAARAFYQPSVVDSMPLAVLDAFRWGVPTFTSRAGGLPEMLGASLAGNVVDPLNVDGVANLILGVVKDQERWDSLSSLLRERYRSKYSREIWASRMNDLIECVRARHSKRGVLL